MAERAGLVVVGLAGSLRRSSLNRAVLRAAVRLAPDGMVVEPHDLHEVPFYDGDVESAGDPPAVSRLKAAVAAADGLLIVTPEYNWGVPAVAKNAVDWLSRPFPNGPIRDKPVAVAGASTGRGATAHARAHLSETLSVLTGRFMAEPQLGLGRATELISDGEVTDEGALAEIRALLDAFHRHLRLA